MIQELAERGVAPLSIFERAYELETRHAPFEALRQSQSLLERVLSPSGRLRLEALRRCCTQSQ